MSFVVGGGERIDHPDPGEGHSLLAGEVVNLLGATQSQCVVATLEERGVEETRNLVRAHRAVSNPTLRRDNLDEWLEPEHPPGAVAHQRDVETALLGLSDQRHCNSVGAHRACGGIARHVDGRAHRRTNSSKEDASTRP